MRGKKGLQKSCGDENPRQKPEGGRGIRAGFVTPDLSYTTINKEGNIGEDKQ